MRGCLGVARLLQQFVSARSRRFGRFFAALFSEGRQTVLRLSVCFTRLRFFAIASPMFH
jgi:hypothetical protein